MSPIYGKSQKSLTRPTSMLSSYCPAIIIIIIIIIYLFIFSTLGSKDSKG